jgi:hypothetical protein
VLHWRGHGRWGYWEDGAQGTPGRIDRLGLMRLHCLCACYGQMLLAYKSQYAGLRKELLRDFGL